MTDMACTRHRLARFIGVATVFVGVVSAAPAAKADAASPTFTNAASATLQVAVPALIAVTATPVVSTDPVTIAESGVLPSGVVFSQTAPGVAAVSGTPAAGSGGVYNVSFLAAEPGAPTATQSFTLTVDEAPVFTSPDHVTAFVGQTRQFEVQWRAYPAVAEFSLQLPAPASCPLVLTGFGDGWVNLSLTAPVGDEGICTLVITLAGPTGLALASQTVTVTVAKQPQTITAAQPGAATVGGTFMPSAASDSGLPVAYSLDSATTNDACSFDGTTLHYQHVGQCVLDIDQPGTNTIASAATVKLSVAVAGIPTTGQLSTSVAAPVYGQELTATARSATVNAWPPGSVQFGVDGAALGSPVTVAAGSAKSPALGALPPGIHTVTEVFTPLDPTTYAAASGSTTLAVAQAATSTQVSAHDGILTATVTVVAPGGGVPSGSVALDEHGRLLGVAPLANAVATLKGPAASGDVTAVYGGDADFTGSSASTTGHDPKMTADVSSTDVTSRNGWYRTAVTVHFACTAEGSALAQSCPRPVTLRHDGAGQSVTRTILSADGGVATVSVRGINIDRTAAKIAISGVHAGALYLGPEPHARCNAHDDLSGLQACTLSRTIVDSPSGPLTRVTATATDRAGNRSTSTVSYRTMAVFITGAHYADGAFDATPGHAYTLVVLSADRPRYASPQVFPYSPGPVGDWLQRAGSGRWTLRLHIDATMSLHQLWNLGVVIDGTMHPVVLRVT